MCVDGEISSANCLHLMTEVNSSISEDAIKVRKPYIITKQRERWTDEEHNKFMEALKLYGRAWRRIEEYVGSKTTVQIRSHAQKFFSKVTRDSSSISPGTVKAIEIPPPRPKRKPNHPYPRNLNYLSMRKGPPIDGKLWPSLPKQPVSGQESKSPTSVLSSFGSNNTVETTAADTLKPCMSPVSSTNRAITVEEIFVEQGSGSKSSSTSGEYKCNQSKDASASLGMQDLSPMEFDLGIQDSFSSKEAAVTGQQITSLKLFGRTVIVVDLQEQSLSNKSELEYQESFSGCNKINLGSQKLQQKDKSDSFLGESSGESNPLYSGVSPMAHCLFSHENHITRMEPNMISFPTGLDLYGVMPYHFSRPLNPLDQSQLHPTNDKFIPNESSQNNSSTTSDSNSEAAESTTQMELPPTLVLKPSKNSAFSSFIPSSANFTRGFVPYKKVVVEKELRRTPVANNVGSSYWAKLGC